MKAIFEIIEKHELSEARSAFYYLSRYLKQAEHYDEYEKDLFVDDFYSAPSEIEKKLTLELIKVIEDASGKRASELTDKEYADWMNVINEIESSLDPAPSTSVIESAEATLANISSPKAKSD